MNKAFFAYDLDIYQTARQLFLYTTSKPLDVLQIVICSYSHEINVSGRLSDCASLFSRLQGKTVRPSQLFS